MNRTDITGPAKHQTCTTQKTKYLKTWLTKALTLWFELLKNTCVFFNGYHSNRDFLSLCMFPVWAEACTSHCAVVYVKFKTVVLKGFYMTLLSAVGLAWTLLKMRTVKLFLTWPFLFFSRRRRQISKRKCDLWAAFSMGQFRSCKSL